MPGFAGGSWSGWKRLISTDDAKIAGLFLAMNFQKLKFKRCFDQTQQWISVK